MSEAQNSPATTEYDWEPLVKNMIELMGFRDYRIEIKSEERRGAVFVYENQDMLKENLPAIVEAVNHLLQMIAKKHQGDTIFLDINNYRHDRENLIGDLARAAAKKAISTKESISLPAMNSYERRLVHVALAVHPEVKTESAGEGKERYVIIKPI